jgi:hypothetical protein
VNAQFSLRRSKLASTAARFPIDSPRTLR